MASIYKRASKAQANQDDSDISMSDSESSGTVQGDSEDAGTDENSSTDDEESQAVENKLKQVPTELRNRILMLTSRGVSFRYAISSFSNGSVTDNSTDIGIF